MHIPFWGDPDWLQVEWMLQLQNWDLEAILSHDGRVFMAYLGVSEEWITCRENRTWGKLQKLQTPHSTPL